MEEQQEELQEEMERLKGLIAVSYGEAEGLRSQIEELKEERVKKAAPAAEVDAAATKGDLACVKQLQQMNSSGDLSLSSEHHPSHPTLFQNLNQP